VSVFLVRSLSIRRRMGAKSPQGRRHEGVVSDLDAPARGIAMA